MGIVGSSLGVEYPASSYWNFDRSSFLTFNQSMNFTVDPLQGIPKDNNLIGYWALDEGYGSIIRDSGTSNSNGALLGASWCGGKYEYGLLFDGVNSSITIKNSTDFQLSNELTLSAWIKPSLTHNVYVIGKAPAYVVRITTAGQVSFLWQQGGSWKISESLPGAVTNNTWTHIAAVYNGTHMAVYVNGVVNGKPLAVVGPMDITNRTLQIGCDSWWQNSAFNGVIDDVRIYNRALNGSEIASVYNNSQPNPVYFAQYHSVKDGNSGNSMLINVYTMSNDIINVTCTALFRDNHLRFHANGTAVLNIWTNLGPPTYMTGVWNRENYTSTVKLDNSSTADIDWNPSSPPSASQISTSLTYAGNVTSYSVFWSDFRSLAGGGYVFSTNNTGLWKNSTWASFNQSPDWGNSSLTLNETVGMIVGFRQFANNSLDIWGNSELSIIKLTAFSNSNSENPTPSISPTMAPTVNPTVTITPVPTSNPASTPLAQKSSQIEWTTVIIITTLAFFVMVFGLAIKKKYVKIYVVDS